MNPSLCNYAYSRDHGIFVKQITDYVDLVVREDFELSSLAEIRRISGLPLKIEQVSKAEFELHLREGYINSESNTADVVADIGQEIDLSQMMTDVPNVEDLIISQDDAPIIRMINALLADAVRQSASDIHIEPYEDNSVVRYRKDGMLIDIAQPHRALHAAISSRIKIMANLDIAEKRLPQDGRISLKLAGHQIDVRVSTLPTSHGERLVLRILDKTAGRKDLSRLGMGTDTAEEFKTLLTQPHGIILVTGPTGSGKSTTLYAALESLDATTKNIVTVEDPVEFNLPGVGQTQVNNKIDLSFARALRAILRQDPDVIMIGEIRDIETAQIAIQASLTGHLVLATLHTNDAVSAITRLVDMGVEPFLLASTLRGVLAQRLVRKLCSSCKELRVVNNLESSQFGETLPHLTWHSVGCQECNGSGFSGRIGIYEFIKSDENFQRLIHSSADETELRKLAFSNENRTLRDDGLRLILDGITSTEELVRVTRE